MAEQRAVRLAIGDVQQRQVRDERLGRGGRDQRRERMVVHEPRDRGAVAGGEMRGNVDGSWGACGLRAASVRTGVAGGAAGAAATPRPPANSARASAATNV